MHWCYNAIFVRFWNWYTSTNIIIKTNINTIRKKGYMKNWRPALNHNQVTFSQTNGCKNARKKTHKQIGDTPWINIMKNILHLTICFSLYMSSSYFSLYQLTATILAHNISTCKKIKKYLFMEMEYALNTGCKLNLQKTFRKFLARLLNVLCKFNLRPRSRR